MANLAHVLVKADAPTETVIHPFKESNESLLDGQVLVHIVKLLVTANTLTYGLAGRAPVLEYFKNFPIPKDAPDSLAMTPAWGTGVVITSRCPDVKVGTRIHGLFTFSPTVVLTPGKLTKFSFEDAAPHRAQILKPYVTYQFHDSPAYKGLSYDAEDYQGSDGGLFGTGWAMAQVAALHPAKPTALIITSASSRTSRGAAFAAKFHKLPLQIIGLTSASNLDYVQKLGMYDTVLAYGDIQPLQKQKVAVQDVAGNAEVQEALYKHFGDNIVYFGSVGMAHSGSAGKRAKIKGLGGSRPAPFLVFTAMEEVAKTYGTAKSNELFLTASKAYNSKMMKEFQADRRFGAEDTCAVYDAMARGKADAHVTYVCSMWPKALHEPVVASSKL